MRLAPGVLTFFLVIFTFGDGSGREKAWAQQEVPTDPSLMARWFDPLAERFPTYSFGRYSFLQGDSEKFQAHHWTEPGYGFSVQEISAQFGDVDHISAIFDGRLDLHPQNYSGSFLLRKDNLGYVKGQFKEFRKYYDTYGGVYYPFGDLSAIKLDEDLKLRIGNFSVEAGLKRDGLPEMSFRYQYQYKDGDKSRLTWSAVTVGDLQRNIAPAWEAIDEDVHRMEAKMQGELWGFGYRLRQRWDFMRNHSERHQRDFSTNPGITNQSKIRIVERWPESDRSTSTVEIERFFWKDRIAVGGSYRYVHLKTREKKDINEYDESMAARTFPFSRNYYDSQSDNKLNSHVVIGKFEVSPYKWLKIESRLKGERTVRSGVSSYPADITDPPDRIIDFTGQGTTEGTKKKLGEGISIQFKAIPKTSVYAEAEFEQVKESLNENHTSFSGQSLANLRDIFFRDTLTHSYRNLFKVGTVVAPASWVNVSTQFRYRQRRTHYEDASETPTGPTSAFSAFFDRMDIRGMSFNSRLTLRPFRWIQVGLRHVIDDYSYKSEFENQGFSKSTTQSNLYSISLTLQPIEKLSITGFYSHRTARTETPASDAAFPNNVPPFSSDVDTWRLHSSYAMLPSLSFNVSFDYSLADNFTDFTATGLPLGTDYEKKGMSVDIRWSPRKNVSLAPRYKFYEYLPDARVDLGSYTVHSAEFAMKMGWG